MAEVRLVERTTRRASPSNASSYPTTDGFSLRARGWVSLPIAKVFRPCRSAAHIMDNSTRNADGLPGPPLLGSVPHDVVRNERG